MLKISISFILAILVVLFIALFSYGEDKKDYSGDTFSGPDYSIEYPTGWEIKKGIMGADSVGFSPPEGLNDTFRENVNVSLEELPAGMSKERYLEASIEKMGTMFGADNLGELQTTWIGSEPGYVMEYRPTFGQLNLHNDIYIIIKGSSAYVITCSMLEGASRSQYADKLTDVAMSFRFK